MLRLLFTSGVNIIFSSTWQWWETRPCCVQPQQMRLLLLHFSCWAWSYKQLLFFVGLWHLQHFVALCLVGTSGMFPVAALIWQQKLMHPRLEAGLSLGSSLLFILIKEVLQCRAKGFVFSSLLFSFWMWFVFHLFMTKKKGLPHKRIKCMSLVNDIQPYLQTIATQTLW